MCASETAPQPAAADRRRIAKPDGGSKKDYLERLIRGVASARAQIRRGGGSRQLCGSVRRLRDSCQTDRTQDENEKQAAYFHIAAFRALADSNPNRRGIRKRSECASCSSLAPGPKTLQIGVGIFGRVDGRIRFAGQKARVRPSEQAEACYSLSRGLQTQGMRQPKSRNEKGHDASIPPGIARSSPDRVHSSLAAAFSFICVRDERHP